MRYVLLLLISFSFTFSSAARQFSTVTSASNDQVFVGDAQQPAIPGSVYVFGDAGSGAWTELQRLSAGMLSKVGDRFGASVSASGNVMAIGAPGEGFIMTFSRESDGTWREQWVVRDASPDFGSSVHVSGDLLLIGIPGTDSTSASVRVYRAGNDSWMLDQSLEASDEESGSGFGSTLLASDQEILVGAPGASEGAGTVYRFTLDSNNEWQPSGQITPLFPDEGALFGSALWWNGTSLAVGAPGALNRTGAVSLFDRNQDGWSFAERLLPFGSGRGEQFGTAITSLGSTLWVGAPGHGNSGTIYSFDLDQADDGSSSSTGVQRVPSPALQSGARFGETLASPDGGVIAGAPGTDNRAGVAFAIKMIDETTDGTMNWSAPLMNEIFGYDSMAGDPIECTDNQAGDFPCKDVDIQSFVSMADLGADRGIRTNDLWGWEDSETGREYAIVGLSNATSFVDVTDPAHPIVLGTMRMTSTARISVWRDMKVYRNHVYIVADGAGQHGIQIFDLTRLRDVKDAPVEFEETSHYGGIFSAHNIVINEDTGFGYSVGSSAGGETCGGGLHMLDLRDPATPVFAGCFSDGETGRRGTGYSHDAQCLTYSGPDADYQGREICIGSNETAISIADVTDKANPVSVAIATYPSVAYAHQGWFTDDQRYFYLNDEIDEANGFVDGTRTLIWDLMDLDDPILAGEYIAETTETDHNLYVKGNLMYQSNTSAGLRIIDITDPEAPFETAFFDTSPVGGRGVSWSNYPYFKSGNIAVTAGHYGLFLLKKREVDI